MASKTGVNMLSAGAVFAGEFVPLHGQVMKSIVGTVARTDTAAKTLGYLPAGSTITSIRYIGQTASDAGTTAILDVGFADGTGKELVNDADLKAAGTGAVSGATAQLGGSQAAAHTITGKYAQTGSASTTGGPWTIVLDFVTNVTAGF